MQNDKNLQQLLKEHEANMPPEILNLIKSFDWKKEVRTIVNQNQLMIDVGADLEESIYLMLLGVLTAADFYERLMDVHGIPEDKARKIIEETENQIFNPMYQKMMSLDQDKKPDNPRDEMLAEIEKEPEPLVKLNFAPKEETPVRGQVELDGKKIDGPSNSSEVTKPFTLSPETTIQTEPVQITAPVSTPVQAEEINPVDTALTKPTMTETPKPYAVDPYREPIE